MNELSATASAAEQRQAFHVFTVGWELSLIRSLTTPLGERVGIRFTHGLVGDSRRLGLARKELPGVEFLPLSKANGDALPGPAYELLSSLESVGVPTVRSMIRGDRVLRNRSDGEAFGYATLLAARMREAFVAAKPDCVLASFDSLHAMLSLAVAKSLGIPWVALAFSVIPDDLTGFCKGIMPDTLVPIRRDTCEELLQQADEIMRAVRAKRQKIMAYRSPMSLRQRAAQVVHHGANLWRRVSAAKDLGVDRFTFPTAGERFRDIVRRSMNHFSLPTGKMVTAPPKGRFAFYPLQMSPESSIDSWAPFYQNQLAFVAQVSLALPADLEFVVKIHFSDHDNYSRRQLLELTSLPRVRIAHPNASSHTFLEAASLVIAIQGTASLEAALLGKPVLLFGASPYAQFPRTERAGRPDQLHEQIRRMLEISAPRDDEVVRAFASYMARYRVGRVNDWTRPIEEKDLEKLADCFAALRSYLREPANRRDWYRQPPFVEGPV